MNTSSVSLLFTATLLLLSAQALSLQKNNDLHFLQGHFAQTSVKWQGVKVSDDGKKVEVCPETYIMKDTYSCYLFSMANVEQALQKKVEDLQGTKIKAQCKQIKSSTQKVKDNLPMPNGGFKRILYSCKV